MPDRSFADHFSSISSAYADFRPRYPVALFDWLAAIAPARTLAWDCACGSGQASVDLVSRFAQVIATDASENQLASAQPHPRITYRKASAEDPGIADASADLVTVAQALHWFDLPRFYDAVRRILKPGGILVVWSYSLQTVEGDSVNALARRFYEDTVGACWQPERTLVETGYRTLDFPFPEEQARACAMRADWPMERLLGYFSSWSATARYRNVHGEDPITALRETLRATWGDPLAPPARSCGLSPFVPAANRLRPETQALNRPRSHDRDMPVVLLSAASCSFIFQGSP